jgi:hypothetical protein
MFRMEAIGRLVMVLTGSQERTGLGKGVGSLRSVYHTSPIRNSYYVNRSTTPRALVVGDTRGDASPRRGESAA